MLICSFTWLIKKAQEQYKSQKNCTREIHKYRNPLNKAIIYIYIYMYGFSGLTIDILFGYIHTKCVTIY